MFSIVISIAISSIVWAQESELFKKVTANPGSKLVLVTNLPNQPWPKLIANVIQLTLTITGTLAFIAFTVGGIMMVTARGKEDNIKKGKDILIWSIIALAIIAISYGIVLGISQLNFF